ncbi:MAG: MoaD/ThiS family protein [Verrucomicrobia bacterium]|nr:MAG: MoaD/ThiS family protein [Verrucomicrobiota bacterium]
MTVKVHLWSYFRELAGCAEVEVPMPPGSTLGQLLDELYLRHPSLAAMRNSTLVAVDVEYQGPAYLLQEQDEVSLFPPVQGG